MLIRLQKKFNISYDIFNQVRYKSIQVGVIKFKLTSAITELILHLQKTVLLRGKKCFSENFDVVRQMSICPYQSSSWSSLCVTG